MGFNGPCQVDLTNDAISVYDAFLGAPRAVGATLRYLRHAYGDPAGAAASRPSLVRSRPS